MAYSNENVNKRAFDVIEYAKQFYEPGRQDRSWLWVWRNRVYPKYHISYKTFRNYQKKVEPNKWYKKKPVSYENSKL